MNNFDWDNSFLVDFDLVTGLSNAAAPSERRLSKMKDMFHDTDAAAQILEIEDPILYRWFELGLLNALAIWPSVLRFLTLERWGMSII